MYYVPGFDTASTITNSYLEFNIVFRFECTNSYLWIVLVIDIDMDTDIVVATERHKWRIVMIILAIPVRVLLNKAPAQFLNVNCYWY